MSSHESKPIMLFETASAWQDWLAANYEDTVGVRLKVIKKASTLAGITYAEALDTALCFGWIDGQAWAFDEDFSLRSFTRRRPASPWSQINRDHVTRLISEGRMQPPGLAEVNRAKSDGRWDAAYRQKNAEVPADLAAALAANPVASAFFASISSQNRFAILFRIGNVKRAQTRERKIREFVAMLERGETLY